MPTHGESPTDLPVPHEAAGLVELLDETAQAVVSALAGLDDWGLAGTVPGQHRSDLVADDAVRRVLERAGVGILSEESGLQDADRPVVVVVDPLDGSTNAAHGIPWFATSLCAVDEHGPAAALVVHLAGDLRYSAVRGQGAWAGPRGEVTPLSPSSCSSLGNAMLGVSGFPPRWLGWRQYRTLGAAALDLCLVASGSLDGYVDCSRDAHGVWDYLGGALVCREAGAVIGDAHGRDLLVLDHRARRTPVAAATPSLSEELLTVRLSF